MSSRCLHILVLFLLVSLSVSAQQWYTNIDVRQPALKPLPAGVSNLLLVNNTVEQPLDFAHVTKLSLDKEEERQIELDLSQAPFYCLIGATEVLDESGELESVSMIDRSVNTTAQFFTRHLLSAQKADSLMNFYQADAILALNQLTTYDILEVFLTDAGDYYASLLVYQNSAWSYHYPASSKRTTTMQRTDTLLWEGRGWTYEAAVGKLPERSEAILDMSRWVGEQIAQQMLPSWETQTRYFYEDKNEDVKAGLEAFRHYRLAEAIDCWTKAYNTVGEKTKTRRTRAYAAANLSNIYEIQGDKAAALLWAQRSAEQFGAINSPDDQQQYVNMQYRISTLR